MAKFYVTYTAILKSVSMIRIYPRDVWQWKLIKGIASLPSGFGSNGIGLYVIAFFEAYGMRKLQENVATLWLLALSCLPAISSNVDAMHCSLWLTRAFARYVAEKGKQKCKENWKMQHVTRDLSVRIARVWQKGLLVFRLQCPRTYPCNLYVDSNFNYRWSALSLIIDYCESIGARRVPDTANVTLELHATSYHVYTIHEWAYMRHTMCVCFVQIMFHAFARIKYWSLMNNLFLLFVNLILVLIIILFERPILPPFLLISLLFPECNIICFYFIK